MSEVLCRIIFFFFFSSRRRHTRFDCDWSSDVCSSDLLEADPTGILVTHYPTGYMIYPDEINKTPWEYPSLRPVVDLDYLVELLKRAQIGRASCRERV